MKKSIKTSLIIIALALVGGLACLVWFVSRPDEPDAVVRASVPGTSQGPSFEVQVEKPRMDRFLGGILPTKLEAKLFGGGELRFGHATSGAKIGGAGRDRLELSADGWDLLIETDGEGRVAPGTRLVFPMKSRRSSGHCAADLQIRLLDFSMPPRGRAPTCSTAASSSSSRVARMPRRGRSSIRKPEVIQATRGRQDRSPSAGLSRVCHRADARVVSAQTGERSTNSH